VNIGFFCHNSIICRNFALVASNFFSTKNTHICHFASSTYYFSWYKRDYREKANAPPQVKKPREKEYGEEFHTKGKSQKIIELFNSIDNFCLDIDPHKVKRSYRKKYIKYSRSGNTFCSLHLWNSLIRIWLKLKYNDLKDPPDCVRDVTNIGHWGVGDVEVAIDKFEQLEIAKLFIKKSFDKNR